MAVNQDIGSKSLACSTDLHPCRSFDVFFQGLSSYALHARVLVYYGYEQYKLAIMGLLERESDTFSISVLTFLDYTTH